MKTLCPFCHHDNIVGAEVCEHCHHDLTHLSEPEFRSSVEELIHSATVESLREHPPVVVRGNRKVKDVIASLVLHQDGCAVVTDEAGQMIGVFTERDLVMKVAGGDPTLLDEPVSKFMTADPVRVAANAPIAFAIHQMAIGGYRHLPIVEDGKVAGMVSIRDIITFFATRSTSDEG